MEELTLCSLRRNPGTGPCGGQTPSLCCLRRKETPSLYHEGRVHLLAVIVTTRNYYYLFVWHNKTMKAADTFLITVSEPLYCEVYWYLNLFIDVNISEATGGTACWCLPTHGWFLGGSGSIQHDTAKKATQHTGAHFKPETYWKLLSGLIPQPVTYIAEINNDCFTVELLVLESLMTCNKL